MEEYKRKTRVRVSGICFQQDRLLLIKHNSLGPNGHLWLPPGGGVEFGSDLRENLIREFKEETGLTINVVSWLCTHEFLAPPLHAIEIFFRVEIISGELIIGIDPEFGTNQIIEDVGYKSFTEINGLDSANKHQILGFCQSKNELLALNGYYLTRLP